MTRKLAFRCAALTVGTAAALALAPAAFATTQTTQDGAVSATFTYEGKFPQFSHEQLTISRDGKSVYDAPVTASECGAQCAPGEYGSGKESIRALDLDNDGQPDIVLELYSGGAHCCTIDEVFSFNQSTNTYGETAWDFGDPGAQIEDLGHNGHYEFLTADDTFAYAFTDFAASGLPIQILSFENGAFKNVTRSYPALIEKDAKQWLRAFDSMARYHYSDSVGVIAAWAADEALLGRERAAERFLSEQAKAGHLKSALLPHQSGEKFIAALNQLLRKDGYIKTSQTVDLHPLSAASTPACGTGALEAKIEQGSPGAGQRYAMLVLTNDSQHSCSTYGYVGMQLLSRAGGALVTNVVRDHSLTAQRIVLEPGAQAYSQLHWSVVPGTGDSGAPCFSAPARVEITPPNSYTHLTIRWAGGTVCEHGRIDVQPLVIGGCGGSMSKDFSLPMADRARP
jgi:Protein of unknown function (DUF4232)